MKKLNLKNLKLGSDDMLQREQLKTVFGGYGGGGPGMYCGCGNGDNVPIEWPYPCTYYWCNNLCSAAGNGGFTGTCIYVG